MRLENIVWEARDPRRLGSFWAAALDADPLTDEADLFDARVRVADEVFLDLCFPRVAEPSHSRSRLHPDLRGVRQAEVVEHLLGLGAVHADVGQGDESWVVLADPEGNPFCVMDEREVFRDSGPIAALPMQSADPDRDARFWASIIGWVPCPSSGDMPALRHPAGVGPLLELCPEAGPKVGKNRLHVNVRPTGDDDLVDQLPAMGACPVGGDTDLPWRVFTDPSGNEFCVLDA
ncbi:VOC family protein [Prauserella halophila]|uniref:VOC family protein n=1 Tax=Prauserella halophila TaxID=185641 RepID=A0ABN1WBY2_9PSEU|nr:VOC family protein [Prauserella halophila]MCP2238447.1 hypothetical protein [Prauserella halophila]